MLLCLQHGEIMKSHKREISSRNKYTEFTTEELLSIFKEEAQYICKGLDEAHSIAESALSDFVKRHGKYVKFV